MRKAGSIVLGLVVAAALSAGCGSRVEVGNSSPSPEAARPAATTPSTSPASTTSTTVAPTSTAPATVPDVTKSSLAPVAQFCAASAGVGLDDLEGFASFSPAEATAKRSQLNAMQQAIPVDLMDDFVAVRAVIDEYLTMVEQGSISTKAQFDDWVVSLVGDRMVSYLDGNKVVLDYIDVNC